MIDNFVERLAQTRKVVGSNLSRSFLDKTYTYILYLVDYLVDSIYVKWTCYDIFYSCDVNKFQNKPTLKQLIICIGYINESMLSLIL